MSIQIIRIDDTGEAIHHGRVENFHDAGKYANRLDKMRQTTSTQWWLCTSRRSMFIMTPQVTDGAISSHLRAWVLTRVDGESAALETRDKGYVVFVGHIWHTPKGRQASLLAYLKRYLVPPTEAAS